MKMRKHRRRQVARSLLYPMALSRSIARGRLEQRDLERALKAAFPWSRRSPRTLRYLAGRQWPPRIRTELAAMPAEPQSFNYIRTTS